MQTITIVLREPEARLLRALAQRERRSVRQQAAALLADALAAAAQRTAGPPAGSPER